MPHPCRCVDVHQYSCVSASVHVSVCVCHRRVTAVSPPCQPVATSRLTESDGHHDGRRLRPHRHVGADWTRRPRLQLDGHGAASLERHARQPAPPHRAVAHPAGDAREELERDAEQGEGRAGHGTRGVHRRLGVGQQPLTTDGCWGGSHTKVPAPRR